MTFTLELSTVALEQCSSVLSSMLKAMSKSNTVYWLHRGKMSLFGIMWMPFSRLLPIISKPQFSHTETRPSSGVSSNQLKLYACTYWSGKCPKRPFWGESKIKRENFFVVLFCYFVGWTLVLLVALQTTPRPMDGQSINPFQGLAFADARVNSALKLPLPPRLV